MASKAGELKGLMIDQDEHAVVGRQHGAKAGFRIRLIHFLLRLFGKHARPH
jgi:hypothetical protein